MEAIWSMVTEDGALISAAVRRVNHYIEKYCDKLEMSYVYQMTMPSNMAAQPFSFNKRNERVDWRRIAAVDVDRVARDLDFQVIQDNLEQITMCNIDMEVDYRTIDPNFIKLFKMAQLTIEYLLLCQNHIASQLTDSEQIKAQSLQIQEQTRQEIQTLKNELNTTKKEAKRRKKIIAEQQKMIMSQHPPYHSCPICVHSFKTLDYLQAHMQRRHPEHLSNREREHDVDLEKEIQSIRENLRSKEAELQSLAVQKAVFEERCRERDEHNQQLRDDLKLRENRIKILEDRYAELQLSKQERPRSPQLHESEFKELRRENTALKAANEELSQELMKLRDELKTEKKRNRKLQNENATLQEKIKEQNQTINSLQNVSGDTNKSSNELNRYRSKYSDEHSRRKALENELNEAKQEIAALRSRQPRQVDPISPVPAPRTTVSPPPPTRPSDVKRPSRPKPISKTQLYLPEYCPKLVHEVNKSPQVLDYYRKEAKTEYINELKRPDDLNLDEKETRLTEAAYQEKMKIIMETQDVIQNDLPNFERIRSEISKKLDRYVLETMNEQPEANASAHSSNEKFVKFKDESRPLHDTHSKPKHGTMPESTGFNYRNEKKNATKHDSSLSDSLSSSPVRTAKQPTDKFVSPSSGISVSVRKESRPTAGPDHPTISTFVGQKSYNRSDSDSDEDSTTRANVAKVTKDLDKKLNDISAKGQRPTTTAVPVGFQIVNRNSLTKKQSDDEDSDLSLTTIQDKQTVPPRVQGQSLQNYSRQPFNQNLSSGEISPNTYEMSTRTATAKGVDFRRPPTADSAKTSNVDSDPDLDEDD